MRLIDISTGRKLKKKNVGGEELRFCPTPMASGEHKKAEKLIDPKIFNDKTGSTTDAKTLTCEAVVSSSNGAGWDPRPRDPNALIKPAVDQGVKTGR